MICCMTTYRLRQRVRACHQSTRYTTVTHSMDTVPLNGNSPCPADVQVPRSGRTLATLVSLKVRDQHKMLREHLLRSEQRQQKARRGREGKGHPPYIDRRRQYAIPHLPSGSIIWTRILSLCRSTIRIWARKEFSEIITLASLTSGLGQIARH